MPTPDQGQGAAQPGGAPPDQSQDQSQGQGTQAPASDMQMLLARWYQAAKEMASADPRLASGAQKVAEGIQDMQQALVTPTQPTPVTQQPSY